MTTDPTPAPTSAQTPAPTGSRAPGWGMEVAVLAVALVGAVAVGRLLHGGWTGPAAWPLVATTVTGVVAAALMGRWPRLPAAAVATVGVVAVAWVAVATSVAGATWFGVPDSRTRSTLDHALHAVRPVTTGWHWPLAAVEGVVLLAALVVGLAAVAARTVLGTASSGASSVTSSMPAPRCRPVAAVVPSLILVATSGLARPDAGAVALVVAFVGAATATLALGEPDPVTGSGPGPARVATRSVAMGLVVALAAVIGGTALGGRSSGAGASGGSGGPVTPTGLHLATDLIGLEQHDARVVMFRAHTPTDTYWQVGQVTVWDGEGWGPDADTLAAMSSSTSPPGGAGASDRPDSWTAQVTMAGLVSRLLPAPPRTTSVQPAGAGTVTAVGVVAPAPSHAGVTYQTLSAPGPTGTALAVAAEGRAAAGLDPATAARDTQVPIDAATLSTRAHQIAGTAAGPLEQAEALVDYFHTGRFHYQVAPTAPGRPGTDPVLEFLDTTRTGNCQTFATAFTLLARALGLPTRVAIGFTGGTRAPDGSTVVRGGDAHAWSEVHLGAAGWVSFEPTPQLPGNQLAPPDVVSATPAATPITVAPTTVAPTTTAAVTAPTTAAPSSTAPSSSVATTTSLAPTTAVTAPTTTLAVPIGQPTGSGGWPWWATAVVLVGLLGLGVVAWRLAGRPGAGHRPERTDAPVVAAYRRATAPLAATAWARPAARSPSTHAAGLRAARTAADPGGSEAAMDDLVRLAALVERSVYGADPVDGADEAWAQGAATRIAAVLSGLGGRAWLAGTRPGDGPSGEATLSAARTG